MWFSSWLRNGNSCRKQRPASRCRPTLEVLEDRAVPATLTVNTTLDILGHANGMLKGGVHIKAADETPMANVMLSLLHNLGVNDMQTFGESPLAEQTEASWRDKIVHARLAIGDAVLMASDAPDGRYQPPQGMMVSLQVDTAAEADRIFNALAEGGEVSMPIQETFWAERFGMCVDRFGIPWMVNSDKAMVPA